MISVIVPVHNTFFYIKECIESILNQTYSDLEIICIDSSTDETTDLLQQMAYEDSRIRVILDSNNSYGYKVNLGICQARGEYISIVDSDDYLDSNMYKCLLDTLLKNDADFVKSDHTSFYVEDGKNVILEYHENISDYALYGKCLDCSQDVSILYKTGISIWTGLYRKTFLEKNHILLNESEGASFQDAGFSVLTHLYGKRIYYLHESFYWYRTDNINSSVKSSRKYRTIADEWDFINIQLKDRGFSDRELITALRIRKLMNYEWNVGRLDEEISRKFAISVHNELREQFVESGLMKHMPLELQDMFDRVYERGLYYIPTETQRTMDLLREHKIIFVGAGHFGLKLLYNDIVNRYFDIQNLYDVSDKIIEIDGFYLPVEKIQSKIYADDSIYFIADEKAEKQIEELLKNAGVSSDQIYVCPQIYFPYMALEKVGTVKTQSKQILVSIIVVVNENAGYLEECLQGLIKQTMEEIEIICVNDSLTDENLAILEQIRNNDTRIKIVIENNDEFTDVRNIGIQYAQGKYVMFCDSNDMLKADSVRKLYKLAEEKNAEIICYDAKYIYMTDQLALEDNKVSYYHREFSYGLSTGREIFIRMVENNDYCDSVNLMFFNRGWLEENKLSLFKGTLYEECAFAVQCMMKAEKVYHTNERFYIYRICPESSLITYDKVDKLYEKFINLFLIKKFLRNDSFTGKQDWALAEIVRKMDYDVKELAVRLNDWETKKLLDMPLTYFMKVELEQFGLNSSLIQRDIQQEYSKEKLEKAIKKAKKIEIYGAGTRGQRLWDYLNMHGYSAKVSNYVVSTKGKQEDKIKDIDILAVDEGWKPCEDKLLVIAFMGNQAKEVYKKYRNKGIANLLYLDDDMARFILQDVKKKLSI